MLLVFRVQMLTQFCRVHALPPNSGILMTPGAQPGIIAITVYRGPTVSPHVSLVWMHATTSVRSVNHKR